MYLNSPKQKVSYSEIEQIENKFSVRLPDSYKEFLTINNGGHACSQDSRFDDMVFFAIADCPTSLESEVYENEDSRYFPIGFNLNEDYLFIDLNTGEIVLNGEIVAESFSVFLSKLLSR